MPMIFVVCVGEGVVEVGCRSPFAMARVNDESSELEVGKIKRAGLGDCKFF